MTSIGSLIPTALRDNLMAAVTEVAQEGGIPGVMTVVTDADEALVTVINGVEYDVRSEAMAQTTCADCPANLLVDVAPTGVDLDLLTSTPRVAVCSDCGRKRVAGKQGTLIHTQEGPTIDIDLTDMSEAQVAAIAVQARNHMVAAKAAEMPKARKKAERKRAKKEREAQELLERDRDSRKGLVLPALSVPIKGKAKEVPALDLSEITDMSLIVAPVVRSPYNKVLYALGRDLLGKDTATYAVVADLHAELMEHSGTPVEALVAVVEPDAKAKVGRKAKIAAFAEVTGMTKKQARKHLETCGVL